MKRQSKRFIEIIITIQKIKPLPSRGVEEKNLQRDVADESAKKCEYSTG